MSSSQAAENKINAAGGGEPGMRLDPDALPPLKLGWGVVGGALLFAMAGTISALWPNPLFVRMTPAGGFEIFLLLAMSAFFGAYIAVRRPACSTRLAYGGGFLGFLGVACPVCNKLLLLLFGSELLLVYFEPVRIYVAFAGALILALIRLQGPSP